MTNYNGNYDSKSKEKVTVFQLPADEDERALGAKCNSQRAEVLHKR